MAQSALSRQIARLEKDVGAPLFSRTSRSVRLTAAGELLEPLARRILADVDNAQAALDAPAGLRRVRLRPGLVQAMSVSFDMVEVMAEYRARQPGIGLHVTNAPSSGMAAAVLDGTLGIAVVGLGSQQVPQGLDHRLLGGDPLVVLVPRDHVLADRKAISLADLPESHPLTQFSRGSGLRRQVEAAFARIALLGIAPGVQNATARALAVPDLTTTVLTLTITGLASDSRAAGGTGGKTGWRALPAGAMFAGGLAGTLAVRHGSPALPLLSAAVLLAGGTLAAFPLTGSGARWTSPL